MAEIFERTFHVGWGDLDSNAHMKNTAYSDKAVDVRMMYFDSQGFSMHEFERLQLGPVVRHDEFEYFREFRLLESVRITFTLAGISPDASRFRLRNEFYRADGKLAARLTTTGGWLDLTARKLTVPPDNLAQALHNLTHSEDFVSLESILK